MDRDTHEPEPETESEHEVVGDDVDVEADGADGELDEAPSDVVDVFEELRHENLEENPRADSVVSGVHIDDAWRYVRRHLTRERTPVRMIIEPQNAYPEDGDYCIQFQHLSLLLEDEEDGPVTFYRSRDRSGRVDLIAGALEERDHDDQITELTKFYGDGMLWLRLEPRAPCLPQWFRDFLAIASNVGIVDISVEEGGDVLELMLDVDRSTAHFRRARRPGLSRRTRGLDD